MRFEELSKDTEIHAFVRKKKYVIAKVKSAPAMGDRIFALVTDGNEISVVAEEGAVLDPIQVEKDFRIISFDTALPFDLIGFLSYITKLLSDQNISLFAISSFSTDHILMKEEYLDKAVKVLSDNKVRIIYK